MKFTKSEESNWKENLIAKFEAQKLAFSPFIFQVVRIAKKSNLLKVLEESAERGLTFSEIEEKIELPYYSLKLILDASVDIGIINKINEKYLLTKVGYFILNDLIIDINMNFVHDVCYKGMFYLEESLKTKKPVGLKVFGEWNTLYEALSQLPEEVKKSWFNFDHFYSDRIFPKLLSIVFKNNPKRILDVGGNTGKWAIKCTSYSKDVIVTIVDLPGQIEMAKNNLANYQYKDRINFHEGNILDDNFNFPVGYDAIWMSQFLDCFSPDEVVRILNKAREAMTDSSFLYIIETYTDRQKYDEARFCLNMTNLYFACIAKGDSKMYTSYEMMDFISDSKLKIIDDISVGISHTVFICKI